MDTLIATLATAGNVAVVALAAMVLILFTLLKERDKTAQEDRQQMITTLAALTEVITQLRIQLAQGDRK